MTKQLFSPNSAWKIQNSAQNSVFGPPAAQPAKNCSSLEDLLVPCLDALIRLGWPSESLVDRSYYVCAESPVTLFLPRFLGFLGQEQQCVTIKPKNLGFFWVSLNKFILPCQSINRKLEKSGGFLGYYGFIG